MRKPFFLLVALLLSTTLSVWAQTSDEPIITIHTHRYETYGEQNTLQFSLLASRAAGQTTIEVDFGYGRQPYTVTADGVLIEDEEEEVITGGVTISGSVSEEGVIRIWGDSSQIDYLDCHGSEVYAIDITKMTALSILELGHNEIAQLDIRHMPFLEYLDVKDNPFTEGLYLGDYPYLKYLNLNMLGNHALDHSAGTVDLSPYKALRVFSAWDSHCLLSLDPSPCQYLQQLSVDNTGLQTLDVTQNANLQILNISDTPIGEIDLSGNPVLVELYCANEGQAEANAKLSTLDVSHNKHLQRIFCGGNNLTTLDVRGLYNLITLDAANNRMTSIRGVDIATERPEDLPVELASLDLSGNYFNYATLPMVDEMTYYYYDLQHELPTKKEYGVCEAGKLDLSEYILRDGTDSYVVMACIARDGFSYDYQLFEEQDFTFDAQTGIIEFLMPQEDSVQVAIINTYFTGMALLTGQFLVRSAEDYGQPVELMHLTPASDGSVTMTLSTNVTEPLYIDFGDGERMTYEMTAHERQTITGQATGRVTLYGSVTMKIEELLMENQALSDIDLNKQGCLRVLSLPGCSLTKIDLGWNNRLRYLNLAGNMLSTLDLTGDNDACNKNLLTDVVISGNHMTEFNPGKSSSTFIHLNAADNALTELDLTDMYSLQDLDLSANSLREIDLSGCENLRSAQLNDNQLSLLDISANPLLKELDIRGNIFTFSTLQQVGWTNGEWQYAPQQPVHISPMATGILLHNESMIGGNATTFEWRELHTEKVLVEGTDYELSNGRTTFLEPALGKEVYCRMSNATFPDFADDNALTTTATTPVSAPQYTIAEFTTPVGEQTGVLSLASTEPDTYIYIDWGDGGLEEYRLQTVYTLFECVTIEGAHVKVYSNTAENGHMHVFSVSGITMTEAAFSPMSDLYCLTVNGAALETIDVSALTKLGELNLNGNNLKEIDLSRNTALNMLILSNNEFADFTLPENNHISWFAAAGNHLTTIEHMPLSAAYNIDLAHNLLESIDLNRLPAVEQLFLSDNRLHTLGEEIRSFQVLDISSNYFDFSTLPNPEYIRNYYYGNQAPVAIECEHGIIDLSNQTEAWEVASSIYFFEGEIYLYEDENGDLQLANAELYEGEDFYNEGGKIHFRESHDAVTGLIINPLYPNILLYTTTIAVTGMEDGVESVVEGQTAIKRLVNSELLIERDGRCYDVLGRRR